MREILKYVRFLSITVSRLYLFPFLCLSKRYTPFGSGLATVIAPHLSHDADHSLFLWDATCCLDYPLHCFFGHRDVILDFDWRKRGDSFQLVSWQKEELSQPLSNHATLIHVPSFLCVVNVVQRQYSPLVASQHVSSNCICRV